MLNINYPNDPTIILLIIAIYLSKYMISRLERCNRAKKEDVQLNHRN
jgi:hypothetical protein